MIRSSSSHADSAARPQDSTWICPICSFSNPVPTNFDPTTANMQTPIPPCLACGIKPPMVHVLKAAIASRSSSAILSNEDNSQTALSSTHAGLTSDDGVDERGPSQSDINSSNPEPSSFVCPRCTFHNHPSLLSCELCGASLVSADQPGHTSRYGIEKRAESPGPSLQTMSLNQNDVLECIKLSFRGGGEKVFYERLKVAMVQRRWLLQTAPPPTRPQVADPKTGHYIEQEALDTKFTAGGGIAGLERRGNELRKNNQLVIGNAFEDLEALMSSAKEIIALAEDFASRSSNATPEASAILSESAAALGMTTTKDMLGSNSSSDMLYVSELARTLAEYLTDDHRGILKKEGGIMSLVDLWAVFNRAQNGVELVSPVNFEKAARQWERLGLPIRLREFKNGLLVVQRHDWTDDKIVAQLLAWLRSLHRPAPSVAWDVEIFGHGATAIEAAAQFGWSVGVATEELEMAEERGFLCREGGVEGIRFWENHFAGEADWDVDKAHSI